MSLVRIQSGEPTLIISLNSKGKYMPLNEEINDPFNLFKQVINKVNLNKILIRLYQHIMSDPEYYSDFIRFNEKLREMAFDRIHKGTKEFYALCTTEDYPECDPTVVLFLLLSAYHKMIGEVTYAMQEVSDVILSGKDIGLSAEEIAEELIEMRRTAEVIKMENH